VIRQHLDESLKGWQSLPAQLIPNALASLLELPYGGDFSARIGARCGSTLERGAMGEYIDESEETRESQPVHE